MALFKNIKVILELFIRRAIRIAAYGFRLFPIRKNRIMFLGFSFEQYTCNPKYIHEYMEQHYGQKFEYIWDFRYPKKHSAPRNTKIVKHNSLSMLYFMSTASVIIFNNGLGGLYSRRKNQLTIETWHAGGAYKKIGIVRRDADRKALWLQKKMENDISVRLSSSKIFTQYNILEGAPFNGEIWNYGMPRNDIFFDHEKVLATGNKVKEMYEITGLTVLYAPTFRGSNDEKTLSETIIHFDQIINTCQKRYKDKTSILVRAHFGTAFKEGFDAEVYDVTDYPDMQELLCAADILITDYSSSIWDYALLGRPCFLYVPDLEEYESADRGFFTPIETWPGIICHDMDELCYEIEHLNEDRCREIARKHLDYAGSYEQGTACETVCKKIVEFCREG